MANNLDKADHRAHLQPSVRVATNWTPGLIRSCLSSADGGYIANAAALCDMVMSDDRCQQALETVVGGVLGLDLEWEPGKGSGAQRALTAVDEDWWLAFPEDETTQMVSWGLTLGVSFAEKVWREENGRMLPGLKFWHPRHARWDWTARAWFMRTADGEVQIKSDDRKWIVFCPYGTYRPWALGKWRGLSEWWLVKDYARMDWARTGEGASTRVATQDTQKSGGVGASKEMRAQLADSINKLGADGVITLPPGWDMKLLMQAATSYQVYSEQIAMANMAIDISVKGQNLTTQVEGGSRAAADVHERVESRVIRFVARRTESALREQGLEEWAEVNFGSEDVAPWPHFHTEEDEDANEKADRFNKVGDGLQKFKAAGFKMEPTEIEEQFGFKVAVDPNADKVENGGAGGGGSKSGGTNGGGSGSSKGRADGPHGARAGLPVRDVRAEGELADGPEYIGRLTDSGQAAARPELAGLVGTMFALIDEAVASAADDDPATQLRAVRERVREAYAEELPPSKLADMISRHLVLARLSGMLAVREEDGGLDPDEG